MPLTEFEIDCIRQSFQEFVRTADDVGDLFYVRLFEIAPELRPLFPADIRQQSVKLVSMLGTIVAQLHDYAQLRPLLEDLARRHVSYGAVPRHYDMIGEALGWTLAKTLGARFDPTVRQAWTRAYGALATAMIEAASHKTS
jgi:hemoglobin-like flavoprotein